MNPFEELFELAGRLEDAAKPSILLETDRAFAKLEEVSSMAARAWSGSWLGYQSRVYYRDLQPPPTGAHFSTEWGMQDMSFASFGSTGDWVEFDSVDLISYLKKQAGSPDLTKVSAAAAAADRTFHDAKLDMQSILSTTESDTFLDKLAGDLSKLKPMTAAEIVRHRLPKGSTTTRDAVASGQGFQVPPHVTLSVEVAALRMPFAACEAAAEIARKAASHLKRKSTQEKRARDVGTNVFIGHGRSSAWRELKDFVQDRLQLPWDEFNRVPVAGVTNQARLAEMLQGAAVALVIMTAEDENAEGIIQARMNVIHEVGLFQGRLGFTKAIVILEDGCAEFSNIQGLGQIRFPSGNIAACFEEVRRVIEREGLLEA